MQHHLTISDPALRELLRRLAMNPDHVAVCPAGVSRLGDRTEWLVHALRRQPPWPDGGARSVFVAADRIEHLPGRLRATLAERLVDASTVVLALGIGRAAGHGAGVCRTGGVVLPLDGVGVVGPGMPRLAFSPATGVDAEPSEAERAVWSRTIGALGEAAWRRLRDLHVAVVGCGRSGSLAATALCRLGLRRLTLLDPDTVELHNVGEMDAVTQGDVGRRKVDAVREALRRDAPGECRVDAVAESVLALPGLVAAKQADVLFCCVDDPGARLAAACLAALYLRPLVDVGSGIFFEPGGRRMGGDVRLVLPGCCLLCLGGVGDFEQARRELLADPGLVSPPRVWRRQRAGSLRSLNGPAVLLALRLLEDLVGRRIVGSIWLHLEFTGAGIPTLEQGQPSVNHSCPLCALTARGDGGVRELRHFFDRP
jgi:molybdopterin/thiamine biosynthesis adenylyltransferase